ncbi:metallophosphoesterase [Hufsiella ginkgonis]|uniref:Metallophosphoesterase n=1 Tax=Hufsiella ginkgonis TaxID=2695274 RepID=A0A7K1XWD9_9SPHI|nr:metallophosphoesterase [Hufsiella ginkgonis]MXV15312.1 metallophosphoesterase [Hufsiella ginkgonis]
MPRFLVPVFILVFLSALIDWYAFQGVHTISAYFEAAAIADPVYWMISAASVGLLIVATARYVAQRKATMLFNVAVNTFLTLLVTKLVFCLVLLGEDIFRLGFYLIKLVVTQGETVTGRAPRSVWISLGAAVVSLIPFFAFLFGITKGKYHYRVHRTILTFADLPEAFDGFRIIQISDIHSGSLTNKKEVQRGVNMINAQKPDLFIFTGDLVNNRSTEIVPLIPVFSQIRAPYGQFSILGNHDYGDYVSWPTPDEKRKNLASLKDHHRSMGFRLLLDEHVRITRGQSHVNLLGVENWGKGFGERGNLAKAMSGITNGEFNLLLSHDPSHWDEQVKNNPLKIHLTFSGHTHGMQFGIEAFGFKWSPVKYRYANWAGLAEENGRYLYVSRGFGFLGFSGRVGIWPEITEVVLRKG